MKRRISASFCNFDFVLLSNGCILQRQYYNTAKVQEVSNHCMLKLQRHYYNTSVKTKDLIISKSLTPKPKVPSSDLVFGRTFTDHMLTVDWTESDGWSIPHIEPYGDICISPTSSGLHYGVQCFEGMKAYKDAQGTIRLFRADANMQRMNFSMNRLAMPALGDGYFECIKQLLMLDESWIPTEDGYSMYIRPTAIGTSNYLGVHVSESIKVFTILSPVGPYFKGGFIKPVKLYADTKHVRAWPGGAGNAKLGGNYGAALKPTKEVEKYGCAQVLWLFGDDHIITEVGTMNIFFLLKTAAGGVELVTPSLERGDILPGITRDSVLTIARHWAIQSHLKSAPASTQFPSSSSSSSITASLSSSSSPSSSNIHSRHLTTFTHTHTTHTHAFSNNPILHMGILTVSERCITMAEILQASHDGNLLETFGTGTAAIIYPVKSIIYENQEIFIPSPKNMNHPKKKSKISKVQVQIIAPANSPISYSDDDEIEDRHNKKDALSNLTEDADEYIEVTTLHKLPIEHTHNAMSSSNSVTPLSESQPGPLTKKLWSVLSDIQYGRVAHPWSQVI